MDSEVVLVGTITETLCTDFSFSSPHVGQETGWIPFISSIEIRLD